MRVATSRETELRQDVRVVTSHSRAEIERYGRRRRVAPMSRKRVLLVVALAVGGAGFLDRALATDQPSVICQNTIIVGQGTVSDVNVSCP